MSSLIYLFIFFLFSLIYEPLQIEEIKENVLHQIWKKITFMSVVLWKEQADKEAKWQLPVTNQIFPPESSDGCVEWIYRLSHPPGLHNQALHHTSSQKVWCRVKQRLRVLAGWQQAEGKLSSSASMKPHGSELQWTLALHLFPPKSFSFCSGVQPWRRTAAPDQGGTENQAPGLPQRPLLPTALAQQVPGWLFANVCFLKMTSPFTLSTLKPH